MGYELFWEPRGVVKRFYGHVTDSDLTMAFEQTIGDARFDDLRYVVNQFLDFTKFSVTRNAVEEIAAIGQAASHVNPKIRVAVVATDPEIVALANQYADSPFNVFKTRIFPTQTDARAWLGLPNVIL